MSHRRALTFKPIAFIMTMSGEEPGDAASDHNVENERDTAPEWLVHRDIKPENIFV